jgi:hypothetical protein
MLAASSVRAMTGASLVTAQLSFLLTVSFTGSRSRTSVQTALCGSFCWTAAREARSPECARSV